MVSVCTYVLSESANLCACGFWWGVGHREVNVTKYLCDVLKQNPLGFPAGCNSGIFQHISELILFDFPLSSGFSAEPCLRTFAFSSLKFLSQARWGNGVMVLTVWSEEVMADFLYIFSSFRSFLKPLHIIWWRPDTAHPRTGVPLLFNSLFFKATAHNHGLPFALGDNWKSSHEYPMH